MKYFLGSWSIAVILSFASSVVLARDQDFAKEPPCQLEYAVTLHLTSLTNGHESTICSPKIAACGRHWSYIRSGHSLSPQVRVMVYGLTKYGYAIAVREDLINEEQYPKPGTETIIGRVHERMVSRDGFVTIPLPLHTPGFENGGVSVDVSVESLPKPVECVPDPGILKVGRGDSIYDELRMRR